MANRAAVDGLVAAAFARLTREQTAARLRAGNTAHGFVNDMAGLAAHPALRRVTVQTSAGPASIVAPPVVRDGAPALGPVPAVGEHSDAIRAEFA